MVSDQPQKFFPLFLGHFINPEEDFVNSTNVLRVRRGVHWDSTQQLSREYPVIRWDSLDKDGIHLEKLRLVDL